MIDVTNKTAWWMINEIFHYVDDGEDFYFVKEFPSGQKAYRFHTRRKLVWGPEKHDPGKAYP